MKSKSVITRHSFIGDQKIHREYYLPNSPTNLSNIPEYFFNGLQIKSEEWYLNVNGKFHRTDGPAYSFWKKNGELECEEWWLDGNRHRTDGPDYQRWYENGQPEYEEWYLDGKEYTKENYWKKMFEMVKQGEIKKTVDMEVNGLSALI